MKKTWIVTGSVFIVAVIALVLFLIISPNGDVVSNSLDINGTWIVFQYGANKTDDEFLVFDDGNAIDYRSGEMYASSKYTYNDSTLSMPDISKEFTVSIKSNNYIVLTEPDTVEWKLARISDEGMSLTEVTAEKLVGEYDVVMTAGEKKSGEIMTFADTSFSDTRDGKAYMSSEYSLDTDAHLLHANEINKDFFVFINGNNLILIDCTDRYVWELVRR